ncbi:hypothetical protein EPUS_03960 [Endocarpon pusillum Z07020]|uniref:Clr5 domain-containing protein n=1 Tax=Endocarpon pusillum (strain Z07020 / HMAS-L-300199) TaxID=1263415 RepID=U1GAH8_ENDPU|nr:uncharacterized protein EPUS_03960 [Endocarpon pusillum Z07020]ERF74522.1 hypothetical protein EPUS_03960 [Endocarpon pusillum Z07020]
MAEMLAVLKEKYGFSAKLGQLQRQLKSWSSLAAATNASPGTVQHTTSQPGAQPTRRKRGPPSINVGGRSQRSPSPVRLADQPQHILYPCNTANPKDAAKSPGVQLHGLASAASSSAVTSTAQHRPFDEDGPSSQADLTGHTEVCRMTTSTDSGPSGKSESNAQVHEFQCSIERQYLKDFLQYIRGLMRDLEIIRDLEPHTTTTTNSDNNDDADKNMLQQDRRRNFAEAEHSKPAAGSAHKTNSTKQRSDNPWPPATILAHPTSPYDRVNRQQWRCASPTLFSIAPSSISGMSTVKSTARRAKRCCSVEIGRDKENKATASLSSAFTNRRHSMSPSNFKDVTGMSSCPSDDNPNVDDVDLCGDGAMMEEGCLGVR